MLHGGVRRRLGDSFGTNHDSHDEHYITGGDWQ
jgi:hypothetical protein